MFHGQYGICIIDPPPNEVGRTSINSPHSSIQVFEITYMPYKRPFAYKVTCFVAIASKEK
jgi:hypothetical protein